jgi:DNA-binding response OmpR family regulator
VTALASDNGATASHKDDRNPRPRARLTPKEFQLLHMLKRHPGVCLTRRFLLGTIWGYSEGTRTRTLDVHIQRLRRKLGPAEASRILTVFGSGYSWRLDAGGPPVA